MSSVSSLNSLLSSSSSTTSSSLDISSLLSAATGATSTGIDVTSAVEAAVYAAQAPERQWQAQQTTIQSQITALTSIQTAASGLSTDLDNLKDPLGALAARTVTSSNSNAVTATASSGTATGSHTVNVLSLATAASWYSPVVASSTASLGSSTLTIKQASGTQTTFSLSASGSNTLSSLVQSINAAGLGITASVIQDASGSRLALVGQNTGTDADFSVTNDGASGAVWSSADLSNGSTKLSAGSFQISDSVSNLTLSVSAGSTLADAANQINSYGTSITANVVNDDTGTHLQITSSSGQDVTVSSDPTLVLTQPSQASNAALEIDGIPVSSQSNTITGALTGVTLNLSATTPSGPLTLAIAADSNAIATSVSQFVSDYNATVKLVSSQFQFSSSTGSQGVLGSDASVRALQSTLLGMSAYTTSPSSSTTASTLANMGISMNDDGTLTLDSSALAQSVATDPTGVQLFFQGASSNGFAASVQAQLKPFTNSTTGALSSEVTNLTQQYQDLQSNVNDYESGYIASQKTLLTSMYSKAEIALQSLPSQLKQLQAELGNNSGS